MTTLFMFPMIVLFFVLIAPVWIIAHYATQWRTSKAMTPSDEQMLTELRESAHKMEDRIRNLERILDEETPEWRSRI